jgi:tRNA (cmo5U34)-methyltransferase
VKTEQVQEHFRVQVPAYPALMERLIPFYDEQQDLMLSLMPKDRLKPWRVLDLGCGPGLMADRVLKEFRQAKLTLFDLTPEMIEECRSRLGDQDRISYRVGDFRVDDFGEFHDIIIASLSLHHAALSERPALAARLFRSLAPGGQLITAEVILDASLQVREHQYELWRAFMASRGEDGEAWYQKHLTKDHPVEISAWVRMLSEAGFRSVGCFWRYLNFAIFSGWKAAV